MNGMRTPDNKIRICNVVLLILMSAGSGVFMIIMPKYADDLWYMTNIRYWFDAQGIWYPTDGGNIFKFGIPWEGIRTTIYEHWQTDNARLCNIVVIFFLLLPKWEGSCVALLCWIGAMYYSFKLSGIGWKVSRLVPVALALWSFMMPWSQQMGALDYQFNYVVSSGMMLCLLYHMKRGVRNPIGYAGIFGASIFIGAWHEGFSFPVMFGLMAVIIFYKKCRRKDVITVLVGLSIGLALLMIAPCLEDKLPREISARNHTLSAFVRSFIIHPAFISFIIIISLAAFKNRSKKILRNPYMVFIIVSGVLAIIMQFIVTQTRRTGWWADLISVIGIMYVLHSCFYTKGNNVKKNIIYIISSVCVLAYWIIVNISTIRFAALSRDVTREYVLENKTITFKEFRKLSYLSLLCLYTPDVKSFHYIPWIVRHYGYYGKHDVLAVIPDCLRNIDSNSGESIDIRNEFKIKEDNIFTTRHYEYGDNINVAVTYTNGTKRQRIFTAFPFISERDGKSYTYLYSAPDLIGNIIGTIKYISIQ